MAVKDKERSGTDQINEAIASLIEAGTCAARSASETVDNVTKTTSAVGQTVSAEALRFVEHGTQTVGNFVAPIAENPFIKYASKVPGINILTTALGQVDVEKAQAEVDKLKQEYPQETPQELAHRIIVDTALKGGGIGLLTNFVPPLALALFAVDIAAVTTLQAEMVYRIAAAYGFSLKDPARRGEVLAIFGLSLGGSGVLKVGLGIVELIPGIGAVIGASSNAALLYSIGHVAGQFYEAKNNSAVKTAVNEGRVIPIE